LLGCDRETLEAVLDELGWTRIAVKSEQKETSVWRMKAQPRREHPPRKDFKSGKPREQPEHLDSPFAQLKVLMNAE
jgi:hypothetical protein